MKQVQRDSKYIIKRIIIGVGVALILGLLKSNNVFADELPKAYLNNFGYNLNEITPDNNWGGTTEFSFDYANYEFIVNRNSDSFYYLLFKDNNNYYLLSSNTIYNVYDEITDFDKVVFTSSSVNYYLNNSLIFSAENASFFQLRVLSINQLSNSFLSDLSNLNMENFYSQHYQNNVYNNLFNFIQNDNSALNTYNFIDYFYNNYDLVSTSPIEFLLDDTEIVPSGYNEIDISNYDGVYFVPKNYNDIQIETVDNINFMDFNFWFKGSIKYGYFPLEQPPNMVSDYQERVSVNEYEYVDSILPLYENTDMTGYQYYSYFIYNSQKGQATKIRYNSTLFNYFLIEDMFTYVNDNVCTIDRNNENMCFKVDFQTPLDNYWLEGFAEGGDEFSDDGFVGGRNKIDAYLDLLKIPFNFLRSLNRDSCSPINLPIPFVGGNIQLSCLSDIFKRTLGNFYNILFYIVSAFYIYFITIKNIDTFTDILNPNDDKLEVIDL